MLAMPAADPSRRSTRLGLASAALILACSTLAAGCSSSGQTVASTTSTSSVPDTAPQISGPSDLLVTDREVRHVGEKTPFGAVLRWWQALQAKNVKAARAAYATSVDTSSVGREIRLLSYPPELDYRGDHPLPTVALQRSLPDSREVTKHDGTVRLLTVINGAVFDKSDPNKVVFVSQTPTAFRLTREGGEWKLANDDFLKQAVTTRPGG
jgi:hypothetical protein